MWIEQCPAYGHINIAGSLAIVLAVGLCPSRMVLSGVDDLLSLQSVVTVATGRRKKAQHKGGDDLNFRGSGEGLISMHKAEWV
jgi:hypothetical protein